ncbi:MULTISPECIES: hypothetical protein [Pseudomonas fluorescens group]|uniref:Uncharacterized protein n=1 Tax=Pseudomonas petroselini TaxID=2899822 RepID=A0ABS8QTZ2_9PSED|nr:MULTISPECIES: hypothetical protein [Pseudomonas fluorescens group]MCD7039162.1 hypothetical protein [Pseudomonas petroselini]MCD7043556.1 hypothetical protein [Pseudomonas petroselini]MCD7069300.1 hypothetical protein [Pseudomonas petroselini]MCD7080584.1 hypothetical protein [Pseudomonas petroselini]MCF5665621.1 hypothetical protein [Pseudomonas marginalis]
MTIAALLAPAVTSALASVVTSLITAQRAPTPNDAGASTHKNVEPSSRPPGRMQNHKLTNLGQTLLQAPSTELRDSGMTAKHAKGFGIAMGGMAAQEAGQKMASGGGSLSKALGIAMVVGGKVAQSYGADKFDKAGTH